MYYWKNLRLKTGSIGFVVIVLFGFTLNKNMKLMNAVHKSKIVCPKLKQIKFKNHYKQEVKKVIYSDIECYMDSINKKIGDNTYKIFDHVPIAIGFSWNGDYKSYFGPDCIKDYVKDLLEIETEINFKLNKPIIFNKEDNLYHDINNTCHICNKPCI